MNDRDLEEAIQYRRALSLIGQGLNITFSNKYYLKQKSDLSLLICSEQYQKAIQSLSFANFPIYWKVFYGMAKYQINWGVFCILKILKHFTTQ